MDITYRGKLPFPNQCSFQSFWEKDLICRNPHQIHLCWVSPIDKVPSSLVLLIGPFFTIKKEARITALVTFCLALCYINPFLPWRQDDRKPQEEQDHNLSAKKIKCRGANVRQVSGI